MLCELYGSVLWTIEVRYAALEERVLRTLGVLCLRDRV